MLNVLYNQDDDSNNDISLSLLATMGIISGAVYWIHNIIYQTTWSV